MDAWDATQCTGTNGTRKKWQRFQRLSRLTHLVAATGSLAAKSVCRDNESYDREGRGWRVGRMLSDSQRERSGMDVERPWMIEPGQAYFASAVGHFGSLSPRSHGRELARNGQANQGWPSRTEREVWSREQGVDGPSYKPRVLCGWPRAMTWFGWPDGFSRGAWVRVGQRWRVGSRCCEACASWPMSCSLHIKYR